MKQKEVRGSGNAMGTTKILVSNSKGEEIFKLKDNTITINLNNVESKKVTLNNGTVLEGGNTYEFDKFERGDYFKVMFIGDYLMFYKYNAGGDEVSMRITKDLMILPYTPPAPQKEWKTFMIETLSQKTDVPYRFFSQYYSMEDAREHHKRAISIMEVKLKIEPVNS